MLSCFRVWAFFKQPASNSLRDIFINAFTLDLWLIMFGTWLLLVFAMIGLGIVKSRLGTLQGPDKIVLQEVFIWAVGAICQQGPCFTSWQSLTVQNQT